MWALPLMNCPLIRFGRTCNHRTRFQRMLVELKHTVQTFTLKSVMKEQIFFCCLETLANSFQPKSPGNKSNKYVMIWNKDVGNEAIVLS